MVPTEPDEVGGVSVEGSRGRVPLAASSHRAEATAFRSTIIAALIGGVATVIAAVVGASIGKDRASDRLMPQLATKDTALQELKAELAARNEELRSIHENLAKLGLDVKALHESSLAQSAAVQLHAADVAKSVGGKSEDAVAAHRQISFAEFDLLGERTKTFSRGFDVALTFISTTNERYKREWWLDGRYALDSAGQRFGLRSVSGVPASLFGVFNVELPPGTRQRVVLHFESQEATPRPPVTVVLDDTHVINGL